MTTAKEILQRQEAVESYVEWVERACRRCEDGDVERPEPSTVSFMERQREHEYRRQ